MYEEMPRNVEDVFPVGEKKARIHLENYCQIIYYLFSEHLLCASHSCVRVTARNKTAPNLLPPVASIPF